MNCTPATPTLSEAFADNVRDPASNAPAAGADSDTDGATESGGGALSTVTLTVAAVRVLPARSRAIAVRVCGPLVAVVVFQLAL